MAPKKRGKKATASTTEGAKSNNNNSKKNPAEAILQHKTKQIQTDKHCPSDGLHKEDKDQDVCTNNPMRDEDSSNGDDDDDDDEDMDDVCLHCQSHSLSVQVRCDECHAYICNHCHWCHEFQANHEIRVCDRCDAFYCRACDEMDQCDDCGEVVCGGCSTLLSCKFCGGGLCEECATACGRCGIVLCSRDAKFAVDCDTCRLSYCLVCLASGNKDPCVRCGHRPSKRMEQLVHLRLKSIYKAFKSSTTGTGTSSSSSTNNFPNSATASSHHPELNNNGGNNNNHSSNGSRNLSSTSGASSKTRMRENDEPTSVDELTPGALMLAAAASAAAPSSQLAAAAAAAAAAASVAPNSQLAAAAQAAAGLAVGSGSCGPIPTPDPRLNARASAETYEAERIKAEEAAAALLAELDEEEQAVKTKKSKKKKKKERQQAKKAEEQKKKAPTEPVNPTIPVEKNVEHPPRATMKTGNTTRPAAPAPRNQKHDANSSHVENTTATTTATATTAETAASGNTVKAGPVSGGVADNKESKPTVAMMAVVQPDPLEIEFGNLLEKDDAEGLEELLASIKGVPGKAMLRKNVKKALKRMRIEKEESEDAAALQAATEEATPLAEKQIFAAPATPTAQLPPLVSLNPRPVSATPNSTSHVLPQQHPGMVTPPIVASPRVAELLTIVSQNHNKVSSNSRLPKGHPGTPKSECIMHMAPLIVGWVIGKGGQRIRDLMEESGARIWIDQDSMGPTEPRIVYVSGQRSNVDTAVRMITDLIAKAPTETPNSKMSTPGIVLDSHHSNNSAPSLNFSKVPGLPVSLAGESGVFQLKPREKKKNGESKAWREMTCDPRFVPLLIGRRGWTIKNIQDSSGARVDIDQNVTPRKITISGSEAAVEIAARMVGDVLSYPHSLLHGTADDMEIFPTDEAILEASGVDMGAIAAASGQPPPPEFEDDPVVPVAPAAEHERPASPVDMQKNRSHHSPPSSLIMTGDGKSTISATSSLSSTPEPSVSTNKAGPGIGQVAPLLPPTFEQQQQQAQHNDMMPGSFGAFPPPSTLPQNQNGLHGGLPPQQQDPVGFGLGQTQQPVPQAPHNPGFLPNNHHQTIAPAPLGGQIGGPPPPPLGRGPPSSFEHQQGPQTLSPFPSDPHQQLPQGQNPMQIHQQNGFSQGLHPLATPDRSRSLVNPPIPPPQQQQQQSALLPGMWDSAPPPQGQPDQARDDFGLEAAVDFLQHNQDTSKVAPRSGSVPQSGVSDLMGLASNEGAADAPKSGLDTALGLDRRTSAPPLLATSGKDDSNIVDSLFGSVSDPRNDAALVSGLRGLSLDPSANESDLWGAAGSGSGFDLPPVSSGQQQHLHSASSSNHNNTVMGGHSIFSALEADDRQHSRFSWGEG